MDVSIDGLTSTKTFPEGIKVKFALKKTAGTKAPSTTLTGTEITNVVVTVLADFPGTDDYGDDTFMSIQKL